MMKRLLVALALIIAWPCSAPAFATVGGQLVNVRQQFLNANGAPLASGSVYLYLPNTTTPVTSYQDSGLTIANSNPIILDSNGMASIWLTPGLYREQVLDSLGNLLFDGTTSSTNSASVLSPGANIGTSGDVSCTATTFTGASNITLPCTIAQATTSVAGKVQLATQAITTAGANSAQAVTPATMAAVIQGQQQTYVVDTGTANNSIVAAPAPAWAAYTAGEMVKVKLAHAINGAATLNVSGLGNVNITIGGQNPTYNIPAGQVVTFIYDGSNFQTTWNSPLHASAHITQCSSGGCNIVGSSNIASVSRLGTGHYQVFFTTAFPNTSYTAVCSLNLAGGSFSGVFCLEDLNSRTNSSVTVWLGGNGGVNESGNDGFDLSVTQN